MDAGDHLRRVEGLGHVIVSTFIEGSKLVIAASECRDHQYRQCVAVVAYLAADLQSVAVGQHNVEHQQVDRLVAQHVQPFCRAWHGIHGVAFVAQKEGEHFERGGVVFNDQ